MNVARWRHVEEGRQRKFRRGGRGGESGRMEELSDNPQTIVSGFASIRVCVCVFAGECVCSVIQRHT